MKIMLDKGPRHIAEYSKRYGYDFWQLRTPLTQNKLAGVPYGLDNGCFTSFDYRAWVRMVGECDTLQRPEWVSCPDMVGDAARTQELYEHFARKYLRGLPIAYVLQNGIDRSGIKIPWAELSAVFVGGDDAFKQSDTVVNAIRTGKMIKPTLKVHIGRVNSWDRARWWIEKGQQYGFAIDSVDGSGMSRFDQRLEIVLSAIRNEDPQHKIAI